MTRIIFQIFHVNWSHGWEYSGMAIPLQILWGKIFECQVKILACYILSWDFTKLLRKPHIDVITTFAFAIKKTWEERISLISEVIPRADQAALTLFSSSSTLCGLLDCLRLKRVINFPSVFNIAFLGFHLIFQIKWDAISL